MYQHLPTGNLQICDNNSITESFIDKVLSTHDCSNVVYFSVVDLIYSDNIKEQNEKFPFWPENKVFNPGSFTT